jgi:hypothetical protein
MLAGALAPYLERDDRGHPVEAGAAGGAAASVLGGIFGNK